MNIISILIGVGVFAVLLVIIAIILIKTPKNKEVPKKVVKEITEFDELMNIVKNSQSSSSELKKALIKFNDDFRIDENNLKSSIVFLTHLLSHNNRSKELFDIVHKELKLTNRKYADDISKVELKCLK
jgi:hypothetical protein